MTADDEKQYTAFLADVAQHELTILRDDGLYRHVRCRQPGTYCMGFDLITWPGHLCYTGDMGTYVFARLPDMFQFFRKDNPAHIDRGYWAEKCSGLDRDGIKDYSESRFRSAVRGDFDSFVESEGLTTDQASELWALIEDDVLSCGSHEHDARTAASDFRWSPDHVAEPRGREVFPDFSEHPLTCYTARFVWCCYALPWAIARYDALAVKPSPAPSTPPQEQP